MSTSNPEFISPISTDDVEIGPVWVFVAVLRRDIYVTGKELAVFLAQVIIQPLLMLFVFGRILSDLGYTRHGYAHLLFPGIVALTATLTALQSTALPLVIDLSYTKEIEDRLLAPLPVSWVAIEKIIFASMRALVAAAMMFPIGLLILGSIPWSARAVPMLVLVLVLASLVGSALGLTLGTLVPVQRISIAFALVLTPLIFTGCSQYPWPSLSKLPWFQWLTTINPITYSSEGMRGALLPSLPHIASWICIIMLIFSFVLFATIGVKGFLRRAID